MPSLHFILVLTEQTPHMIIIIETLDLFVSRLYGTACLVIGTCGERTGFMLHESDGLHFSKQLNDALFHEHGLQRQERYSIERKAVYSLSQIRCE